MEQQFIESREHPDSLTELYGLLSEKVPLISSLETLVQKGFTEQQAQMIMEINNGYIKTLEQLNYYVNTANKPIIDQNVHLTMERNEFYHKSGQETMILVDKLKKSLIDNATGTLSAYNRVITIYTVSFVVGIMLIITAVIFGALGKTILAVAFGSIGLIDIVTYFIKLPADKIQDSRSNLSQLQVVLLVWLKELINNDALCSKILNVENPSIIAYKELTDISINNTTTLLKLIEDLAKPKS